LKGNPFDVIYAQRDLSFAVRFQVSQMILVRSAEEITMRAIIRRLTDDFSNFEKKSIEYRDI
jgi:hypothetical protein